MAKADVPLCPETGRPMQRGVRQVVLTYEGVSEPIAMPGWYCDDCDEGVHTPEDMTASDRMLGDLKRRASQRHLRAAREPSTRDR